MLRALKCSVHTQMWSFFANQLESRFDLRKYFVLMLEDLAVDYVQPKELLCPICKVPLNQIVEG